MIKEIIEGIKNPYLKYDEMTLKRKQKSFQIQLADLEVKKKMGTEEYNSLALKLRQVQDALKQI